MQNPRRLAGAGVVLAASLSAGAAQTQGEDPKLLFETGLAPQFKDGQFHFVPVFVHLDRPPTIPLAECKVADSILADICTNCEELKSIPAIVRATRELGGKKALMDKLHSVLFTTSAVPLKKFKGAFHFKPGAITALQSVIDKHGPPAEKEPYPGKAFRSWVGLDGIVHWWGYLGIGASPKGEITHILIREQEKTPASPPGTLSPGARGAPASRGAAPGRPSST